VIKPVFAISPNAVKRWPLNCKSDAPLTVVVESAVVYAAGLAFTARDLLQDALGKRWVAGAVLVGAALSALVSPQFALASGGAFLVSEFADFVVYTPLRRRDWVAAVAVSNAVGLVIDSALFLLLAFGSLDLLAGQVVGKAWMTALAIVALGAARRWRRAAA
jgi:uncharacterized PurR-regulated membrane protein YhhQ (DUF165 family)